MIGTRVFSGVEATGSPERLFSGLLQCTKCGERRTMEIRRGEYLVLRRDGTVQFECSVCAHWTSHRLVRIAS